MLTHILLSWLVSALALWLVALLVPGIMLRGFGDALIATIIITVVNATLGVVLKFLMFPLTILTLGLFLLVINAILLKLASLFSPGFRVVGFIPALIGSLALTIITAILRHFVFYHSGGWAML